MGEGAVLGSPLADSLGDGADVVAPSLAGVRDASEEDDGDGAGEVAVPSPDFGSGEPDGAEESAGSEGSDDFEDVVPPVTAPLTVVPEPPLKVLPETSS
ncbi:hypothetical protein ABTY98_39265 [Streptomyces sp. NPDC096040]|uniref:hypothetical protein n=1 Tax=Streptomyces sp. NPDC096040 TaxID=3155541 RepID=UPI0033165EA4